MKKVEKNKGEKTKENKKRRFMMILLFIIIIIILLLLKQCGAEIPDGGERQNNNEFDLGIDENARKTIKDTQDYKDAQDRVNEKIAKMYLNIAINTTPVMQKGTKEGNFNLKNIESNQYIVVADIVRKLNVSVNTANLDFKFREKSKKDYTEEEQKAYNETKTIAYIELKDYKDNEKEKLKEEIKKLLLNELGLMGEEEIYFDLNALPINNTGNIYVEHLIYRSKGIPIGSEIATTKLDYPLEKGQHNCRVYYNAFDPETGENIGKCGAEMIITVKN